MTEVEELELEVEVVVQCSRMSRWYCWRLLPWGCLSALLGAMALGGCRRCVPTLQLLPFCSRAPLRLPPALNQALPPPPLMTMPSGDHCRT